MRKKFSESFSVAGGAIGDFLDNGWNPMIMNVSMRRARSGIFLRMHMTTASTSSFSSANSNNERKVCFEASGGSSSGIATYKMLLTGFRTDSHLENLFSVTCNLMVIRIGFSCCKICLTTSWQSSSEYNDGMSPFWESPQSKSEHSDPDDEVLLPNTLPPAESTEVFRE